MVDRSALIPLAIVTGAHGVRGELRVKLLNPDSRVLASGARVWLRPAAGGEPSEVALRAVRARQPGTLLVSIPGCEDRDAAEAMRGVELSVPRERLPALPPGEFYLVDLVGLQARLPDGSSVGEIEQAIEYPAAQVIRVRVARGVVEIPLFAPYLVAVALEERAVIVQHVDELDVEPPARS